MASEHAGNSISPEQHQAKVEGVLMVIASFLAPITFIKFRKRTAYIICTVVASLSMTCGKIETLVYLVFKLR